MHFSSVSAGMFKFYIKPWTVWTQHRLEIHVCAVGTASFLPIAGMTVSRCAWSTLILSPVSNILMTAPNWSNTFWKRTNKTLAKLRIRRRKFNFGWSDPTMCHQNIKKYQSQNLLFPVYWKDHSCSESEYKSRKFSPSQQLSSWSICRPNFLWLLWRQLLRATNPLFCFSFPWTFLPSETQRQVCVSFLRVFDAILENWTGLFAERNRVKQLRTRRESRTREWDAKIQLYLLSYSRLDWRARRRDFCVYLPEYKTHHDTKHTPLFGTQNQDTLWLKIQQKETHVQYAPQLLKSFLGAKKLHLIRG